MIPNDFYLLIASFVTIQLEIILLITDFILKKMLSIWIDLLHSIFVNIMNGKFNFNEVHEQFEHALCRNPPSRLKSENTTQKSAKSALIT